MRTTLLAFLGAVFIIYWLLIGEGLSENMLTLGPVTPGLISVLDPPYDLEEPLDTDTPVGLPLAKKSLKQWLGEESLRLARVDPDPIATSIRLQQKALNFSKRDLRHLKRLVLNRSVHSDQRFLAVYMLGLSGPAAHDMLKELSFSQIPGLPSDRRHSDEVILRAQALEALVQKLSLVEARALLRELLSRTSDPILARHAQYWLHRLTS